MLHERFSLRNAMYNLGESVRVKFLSFLICVLVLLGFLACERICPSIAAGGGTDVDDSVSPVIQDFYINNIWAGQPCQFSFNVTDSVALGRAIFGCNATQTFVNETALSLSGTQAWVNATETLPSFNCLVSFQLWVWNEILNFTTTGLRYMKVYTYDCTPGAWNTPFISLGSAITTIEAANNWSATNSYPADVLSNNVTSLQTMIDNYASAQDWRNVLAYSAICNKLGAMSKLTLNMLWATILWLTSYRTLILVVDSAMTSVLNQNGLCTDTISMLSLGWVLIRTTQNGIPSQHTINSIVL